MADLRQPPGLASSILADARVTAAFRGERHEFHSRLDAVLQAARLAFASDAFLAQALHRLRVAARARRLPLLPTLLRRLAIASAALYVDDRAVIHPGVYIVHGQVVVEGAVEIHPRAVISPAVTLAAEAGAGPLVIGPGVSVGTGARVLGSLRIGARARIGAGSVVLDDVPAGATATGIPALVVAGQPPA